MSLSFIERMQALREHSNLLKTIPTLTAVSDFAKRISSLRRLKELRELLGANPVSGGVSNSSSTATAEAKTPVESEESTSKPESEPVAPRVSTAHFYAVNEGGKVKRNTWNNLARNVLAEARKNPDFVPSDSQKEALAKYSGCGGGLTNGDGKIGSQYEYYTPKPIAEGMWDVLKQLGFSGGKVLDPCSGAGIFGATAPLNCAVDAIELSEESALVNKLINGGVGYKVENSPFERYAKNTPDGIYDAIVTNVPFGEKADRGANYAEDSRYQDENLQSYFILRSLEKLKPGGMAAFIVPTSVVSTKGGRAEKTRRRASLMAEFIGGYRLPHDVFKNASADVMTDVIFFRKFGVDSATKIAELAEQDAQKLKEFNVLYEPFIEGKYFESTEGKKYVLGTWSDKPVKDRWGKDRVILQGEMSSVAPLMRERRLPQSRIDWSGLNATETEPITYNDGDCITQAGVTLQMKNGVWHELPKKSDSIEAAASLESMKTPYDALVNGVEIQKAEETYRWYDSHSEWLSVPAWVRQTLDALKNVGARKKSLWKKALIGQSVDYVVNLRSDEKGVNYKQEYPQLSEAMKKTPISIADDKKVDSFVRPFFALARLHYTKGNGFSKVWLGDVNEEVTQSSAISLAQNTPKARFANICYMERSTHISLDRAKELMGDDFDPYTSDDWCLEDDGNTVVAADDYYVGNYGALLSRLDREIESCTNEKLRQKLLSQKAKAATRVKPIDVDSITFDLLSPHVTMLEKLTFCRQFIHESAFIATDGDGKQWIDFRIRGGKSTTDEEKLIKRLGAYMKNRGSITLGGTKFENLSPYEALQSLRGKKDRANNQFNSWAQANVSIMERLRAKATNPDNLEFVRDEDSTELIVPGLKPSFHLRPFQSAFVREMGHSFGGINGFDVGLGKTFTALASVQHVHAIGVKKKTVFVVPNSVLSNWQKEASRAYETTDDCLFVGLRTKKNGVSSVQSKYYDVDLELIKQNRHSKIFMSMEAFERIRLKESTVLEYMDYMGDMDSSFDAAENKKESERKGARAKGLAEIIAGDTVTAPYLEDLGIDSIVIDEAHFYKNSTNVYDFKGAQYLSISKAASRGQNAMAKTWYIRGLSPLNDGVLLLTATPITNSPLEIYSMLTLAVGHERVNNSFMTRGSDEFMTTICNKGNTDAVTLDGKPMVKETFLGLNNANVLRTCLHQIATIKDAKTVGSEIIVPDEEVEATSVTLDSRTVTELEVYKKAFRYAIELKHSREGGLEKSYQSSYDLVKELTGEDESLIGHPFNLINKMVNLTVDRELDKKISVYNLEGFDREKIEACVNEFNSLSDKKQVKVKLHRLNPLMTSDNVVSTKIVNDPETGSQTTEYVCKVIARYADEADTVLLDDSNPDAQDKFEAILEANGLGDYDVTIPPKLAALIKNVNEEMANPRGAKKADGSPTHIVKQIIFCDLLGEHNKIRHLLSKKCGIPKAKIAIVTGQRNNSTSDIQNVQDGFNAEDDENVYQVVIANEKAEVGINLQMGTQAIHHLTIGWTPDSLQQRNGRGVRQGNRTEKVKVYYYDADGTFDSVKRTMVNKKNDWISNLTSADSNANKVDISGGLTDEEMRALIEIDSNDPDAIKKLEEAQERRKKEMKKLKYRSDQLTNIDTFVRQSRFMKDLPDERAAVIQKIADLLSEQKTLKADEKACEGIKDAAKQTRARNRLKKRREAFDARKLELADITIICLGDYSYEANDYQRVRLSFTEYWTTRISEYEDSLSARDDSDYQRILNDNYHFRIDGVEVGQTHAVVREWRRLFEQAKGMSERALKDFEEISTLEGAYPASIAQAFRDGKAMMVGEKPLVDKCFVIPRNGRPKIIMIADDGERLVGIYQRDVTIEKTNTPSRYVNAERDLFVYQGTDEYDDFLKKAGEADSAFFAHLGGKEKAGEYFSKYNPAVEEYIRDMEMYRMCEFGLPSPYFPIVIGNKLLTYDDEIIKRIFEEQKAVIGNVYGDALFTIKDGVGVKPVPYKSKESEWSNKYLYEPFYDYVVANNLKITDSLGRSIGVSTSEAFRKCVRANLTELIEKITDENGEFMNKVISGEKISRKDVAAEIVRNSKGGINWLPYAGKTDDELADFVDWGIMSEVKSAVANKAKALALKKMEEKLSDASVSQRVQLNVEKGTSIEHALKKFATRNPDGDFTYQIVDEDYNTVTLSVTGTAFAQFSDIFTDEAREALLRAMS